MSSKLSRLDDLKNKLIELATTKHTKQSAEKAVNDVLDFVKKWLKK